MIPFQGNIVLSGICKPHKAMKVGSSSFVTFNQKEQRQN